MAEVSTPTTRLEAVNSIIASVGEPPVADLSAPSRQAVILGTRAIDDASRMIQSKGWYWNTEEDVTLTVGGSGYLNLATTVLRAKVNIMPGQAPRRSTPSAASASTIPPTRLTCSPQGTTLRIDQVLLRPFEELPEPARHGIWARGGVLFQSRHLGADALYAFTENLARAAWAGLLQDELEVKRWNLDESGALRDLVFRR